MIPVVTVIGLEFGGTIAFAVVTESVFAWPGMGKLIIDSINVLDRPVMVAYLMIIVLMFVVDQPAGGHHLHGARSPRPAGGQGMSTDRRSRPPRHRRAAEGRDAVPALRLGIRRLPHRAVGALVVFALIALVAIFAPWIAPQNPYDLAELDIMDGRLRARAAVGGAGITYWLGTDDQGRDMLSGIIYGLRISLIVGAGSALIACVVGASLGHARRLCRRARPTAPSCAWSTCSSPSRRSWWR